MDLASLKQSWQLCELLRKVPVPKLPNFAKPFVIDTDAYEDATGAILLQ